jgi:hypothetical protein
LTRRRRSSGLPIGSALASSDDMNVSSASGLVASVVPRLVRTVFATAAGLSLLTLNACGAGQRCPWGCPAAWIGATVVVTSTSAMPVSGVQATLIGPVTATMSCQPNSSAILCSWPAGLAVVAGSYSLRVSAPGYQTTAVRVEVATPAPDSCGCSADSIQPSTVALGPSDGGLDKDASSDSKTDALPTGFCNTADDCAYKVTQPCCGACVGVDDPPLPTSSCATLAVCVAPPGGCSCVDHRCLDGTLTGGELCDPQHDMCGLGYKCCQTCGPVRADAGQACPATCVSTGQSVCPLAP